MTTHPHVADLRDVQLLPVEGKPVPGEPERLPPVLTDLNRGCPAFRPIRFPARESNQFR